ncbi:MAG: hypothetical protein JXR59_10175 [Desulfuromonadaceae bacterium]|nr:hypothetical protein [Desulfuromonadaceae bacterium]
MLILTCTTSAFCFSLQPLSAEAAHNQKGLIVLDARPQKGWQQGHLPGAFSFSWEDYTRTDDQGVKYRTLPAQELALALGRLGITEQSSLLIYGDADSSWGGEGWLAWALAWIGHQGPVYVLDGGIQAWQQKGFSLTTETPAATAAVYQTQPQPTVAIAAADIERLGTDINLVDTRSYFTEWLPSHLPGAIHINWEKFFSAPQRRPLSPQACRALLEENGIDLNKPVVYYCTGGIRSGYAWMVHQLAGLPGAINFEGGTEEWAAHRR